jgi:hypothetical protein
LLGYNKDKFGETIGMLYDYNIEIGKQINSMESQLHKVKQEIEMAYGHLKQSAY